MSSNDDWQEGQYDALAKISPELRAQLEKWAPKGPSARRAGVFSKSSELSQLSVPSEHFGPRLA
jgi:hypothetical protein